MRKTHTIAIIANKGGVGKTTTAVNTAARLSQMGYSVLVVDLDKQCNLTRTFLENTPSFTIYEALLGPGTKLPKCKINKNLTLVPASPQLFGIEGQLRSNIGINEELVRRLERLLKPELGRYDYIIIDTSAIDNILTINALNFTHDVLFVTRPEQFSVESLYELFLYVRRIRDALNPQLRLTGVLITGMVINSVGHVKGEEFLRNWLNRLVMKTVIRHSRPLYTSILARKDVFTYAPASNGALDYEQFVKELIDRTNSYDAEQEDWGFLGPKQ